MLRSRSVGSREEKRSAATEHLLVLFYQLAQTWKVDSSCISLLSQKLFVTSWFFTFSLKLSLRCVARCTLPDSVHMHAHGTHDAGFCLLLAIRHILLPKS
jgi:hypothetical protein